MTFRSAFELIMSLAYAALGAAFLFTTLLENVISRYRDAIGVVLMGYSLLRIALWYRKRRRAQEQ